MSPTLPAVIRARRQAVGLTIEALAFASGLSVATVQRVETGKHDATLKTLERLAGPLKSTAADLLAGSPEPLAEATS